MRTLVESSLLRAPPHHSHRPPFSLKSVECHGRGEIKKGEVMEEGPAGVDASCDRRCQLDDLSFVISAPLIAILSVKEVRWGDVYLPTRKPASVRPPDNFHSSPHAHRTFIPC